MSEEFTSRRLSEFGLAPPSLVGGSDPSPRQGEGGLEGGWCVPIGGCAEGGWQGGVSVPRPPPPPPPPRPCRSAANGRGCVHIPRACMPVSRFSCRRSCLVLCARRWASISAGFSTCTAGRPSWSAGPWSIVHEPGRPLCGRRHSCCAVACPAGHEPVGARATRRGNSLCGYVRSRARPAPA